MQLTVSITVILIRINYWKCRSHFLVCLSRRWPWRMLTDVHVIIFDEMRRYDLVHYNTRTAVSIQQNLLRLSDIYSDCYCWLCNINVLGPIAKDGSFMTSKYFSLLMHPVIWSPDFIYCVTPPLMFSKCHKYTRRFMLCHDITRDIYLSVRYNTHKCTHVHNRIYYTPLSLSLIHI